MNVPKFSVLSPVYNVSRWLGECVRSVLSQDCGDFELILIDDGSTDDSGILCDAWAAKDGRIRVFHQENGGLISARRAALARAKGEYCVFLDSDDSLEPGALSTLASAIAEYSPDCLVYGIRWAKPDGDEALACPPILCGRLYTDRREALGVLLSDGAYNSLCRKCVRRTCFDGRDFSPYFSVRRAEDLLQSTEIYENAASYLFLPELLYRYRVNTESITHTICYDGYRADFTVERALLESLRRLGVFDAGDCDRLRNRLLDELVLECKRLCRFCTTKEESAAGLRSIAEDDFFRGFLAAGYRPAPRLAGQKPSSSGARLAYNRAALSLLKSGRYGALIALCSRV